jgi:hypothetical protein
MTFELEQAVKKQHAAEDESTRLQQKIESLQESLLAAQKSSSDETMALQTTVEQLQSEVKQTALAFQRQAAGSISFCHLWHYLSLRIRTPITEGHSGTKEYPNCR